MNIAGIGRQEDIIALGLAGITQLHELESEERLQVLAAIEKFPQADAIIIPEDLHAKIAHAPEAQKQFIITIPSQKSSQEPDRLAALAKEVLGVSIKQEGDETK